MENIKDYYRSKRILVTGSAGFIGSSLVNALSPVDCTLICVQRENRHLAVESGVTAQIQIHESDIRRPSFWDELIPSVDIIFHCAAQTSSHCANMNPRNDMDTNLVPIVNLIEACHTSGLRPDIIFPGTATEVGLTEAYPVNEGIPDNPVTVYDINKLAVEKYLHYYSAQMGGRAVTLRLANVYGPGPRSSRPDRGILNLMVMRALQGETLSVFGEGNFVRDYIYITDVIHALLAACMALDNTQGRYYYIGSGEGHTVRHMIEMVAYHVKRTAGTHVAIEHIPSPPELSAIEFRNFVADTGAFQRDSGWKPTISLEEGIDRTIQFFSGKDLL